MRKFLLLMASLALALTTLASPATADDDDDDDHYGGGGEAPALVCNGLPATILGTSGSDTVSGTEGPDVISTGGGNDRIEGQGGNDTICSGSGHDVVFGLREVETVGLVVSDNDWIDGGDGFDVLVGDIGTFTGTVAGTAAAGTDTIYGGEGGDLIVGLAKRLDIVLGGGTANLGTQADSLYGGGGSDIIVGAVIDSRYDVLAPTVVEGGNHYIEGGAGDDLIYGDGVFYDIPNGQLTTTGFRDTINSGDGNDRVFGDFPGTPPVVGVGAGLSDTIDAGAGSDNVDGGPGTDVCSNAEATTRCP